MGGDISVPTEEITDLIESTHFDKRDLKRWYKKFMKDYPDGKLNKTQFIEIYGKTYGQTPSSNLAEHIFRSFDHNSDGYICFKELMVSLSVTSKGSLREKLEWLFNVYDLNGDGKISLEEVCHVVECMKTAYEKKSGIDEENALSNEELTDMFKIVDVDSNGYWSTEEFIDGMRAHPTFVKMLKALQTPSK